MNRVSQYAQRASSDLHTYLVFKGRQGQQVEHGVVTEVLENGVNVMLPRIGLESFLPLPGRAQDTVRFECADGQLLTLYEPVSVQIQIALEHFRKQITLTLVK